MALFGELRFVTAANGDKKTCGDAKSPVNTRLVTGHRRNAYSSGGTTPFLSISSVFQAYRIWPLTVAEANFISLYAPPSG